MIKHHCIYFMNVYAQNIRNQLILYLAEKNDLLVVTPQSAAFGFVNVQDQNCLLFYHLILIFKYNIYNPRVNNNLNFQNLKYVLSEIKCIEEAISNDDINKKRKISNKWKLIDKLF